MSCIDATLKHTPSPASGQLHPGVHPAPSQLLVGALDDSLVTCVPWLLSPEGLTALEKGVGLPREAGGDGGYLGRRSAGSPLLGTDGRPSCLPSSWGSQLPILVILVGEPGTEDLRLSLPDSS